MLKSAVPTLPAFVAAAGLVFAWWQWRERELRREDVLKWGNEAIDSLQSIWLAVSTGGSDAFDRKCEEVLLKEAYRTSLLVEQGRLFFKNQVIDSFGSDKPPAYRGYRPLILDPLVLGHQIACKWPVATVEERVLIVDLSLTAVRALVSLLQKEVGRGRTASVVTQKGGRGIVLDALLLQKNISPWPNEELDQPKRGPLRLRVRAALHRSATWLQLVRD